MSDNNPRATVTCHCGEPSSAYGWEGGAPIAEYRHILHSEAVHGVTPEFPILHEWSP